jgi:hypothetical protein
MLLNGISWNPNVIPALTSSTGWPFVNA